jgi:ubiquinone/menaquinone biosynthesis C-methylase UbiE
MTADVASADYYAGTKNIPEVRFRMRLLSERLNFLAKGVGARILEVGVGSGDITLALAKQYSQITFVEPDPSICRFVLGRLKEETIDSVDYICSGIEQADLPVGVYDYVIMLGVLEHIQDPILALQKVATLLKPGGSVHISVNLAGSLHRWLGVSLGILSSPEQLTDGDRQHGHFRIYTAELLANELNSAGLTLNYSLPFYLKPLPTAHLATLPENFHDALFLMGQKFPEFASYLYVEAHKTN